jgi:putative membrane protein
MKTKPFLISAAWLVAAAMCGPELIAQTGSGATSGTSSPAGSQTSDQGSQSGSSMSQGSSDQGTNESGQSGSSMKHHKMHSAQSMGSYPGDKMFLQEAVDGNNAEIDVARMAESKGQSAGVRQFAEQMIREHGLASNQFRRVMDKVGVALPDQRMPQHQKVADRLSHLQGKEFDQAYAAAMVKDHQKMIAMFEQASQSASSADVKQLAQSLLPTLRQHLQMAQQLPNG